MWARHFGVDIHDENNRKFIEFVAEQRAEGSAQLRKVLWHFAPENQTNETE